ncbi:hypothetical protein D9M72_589420 [compost metagenome]
MPVVGPVACGSEPVLGTAIPQLGILGAGRGLLKRREADRLHGNNDGVGAGCDRFLDQPLAIVVRIGAVSIDADQIIEGRAIFGDREIDGGTLDTLGIMERQDARIVVSQPRGDFARTVGAAAIGNQDDRIERCQRRAKPVD